jgi:hypothetical protein
MADQPRIDALSAWLDALRRLGAVAGSVTDPSEAIRQLQELQEDVVRGMFLPVDVLVQVTDQLAKPLREQARAFERASAAFAEIATLLRGQADLLESTGRAVRGPAEAVKAAVGAADKPRERAKRARRPRAGGR